MTMPILVQCQCGASLEVDPELAGGTIDCTECQSELRVPTQEWSDRYREALTQVESESVGERRRGYQKIVDLGTASSVVALMGGLRDSEREVTNVCLRGLMLIDPEGQSQIVELLRKGVLSMPRLVAMIREESFEESIDVLCEWIDAGTLTQGHISEAIPLLGESKRSRALATLRALRRVYPNLHILIDDALSNFSDDDGESVDTIPESARAVRSASLKRVQEMAESQRTLKKGGCLGMLLLAILPGCGLVAASLYYLLSASGIV